MFWNVQSVAWLLYRTSYRGNTLPKIIFVLLCADRHFQRIWPATQRVWSLLTTSRGTRRCPGWPMAKPDSNFVYYVTKKGGRNKLWKCVRVKYAPCYVRKGPVLTQKYTRARRKRQHRERIQCLVLQLILKQRHVTKLECYHLFEMSLKFFVFPSGAGMQMFVGFPTLEHATYICPCEKHGSQCCHAVCETFPRKD